MNDEELANAPEGKIDGVVCKSVSLNPLRYLEYLRKQLAERGVQIIHHRLKAISEAFLGNPECGLPAAKVVVNASGLGAGHFGDVSDELVEPIRGQTILIRPPRPLQLITRVDEECIYIGSRPPTIPGDGEEVILGGCYQPGNSSLSIDPEITHRILTETLKLCPDISRDGTTEGIEILDHIVALRPSHKNGPRLESVKSIIPKEGDTQDSIGTLVHCYGIGLVYCLAHTFCSKSRD
jgi:glycine/D-amino acid oxidase-like deaminating enzyme